MTPNPSRRSKGVRDAKHSDEYYLTAAPRSARTSRRGTRREKSADKSLSAVKMAAEEDVIVKLNVGGSVYYTTKATLGKRGENMLTSLISGKHPVLKDENGCIFIDRNGACFEPILDFLRTGNWIIPSHLSPRAVTAEADYYCINLERLVNVTDYSLRSIRSEGLQKRHQNVLKEHKETIETIVALVVEWFTSCAKRGDDVVTSPIIFPSKETILASIPTSMMTDFARLKPGMRLPPLPDSEDGSIVYLDEGIGSFLFETITHTVHWVISSREISAKRRDWWMGYQFKTDNAVSWSAKRMGITLHQAQEEVPMDCSETNTLGKWWLKFYGCRGVQFVWADPFSKPNGETD